MAKAFRVAEVNRSLWTFVRVNFDRSRETVGKPEARLAKPLKTAALAQAYRKALGQHDEREIYSLASNQAE
jgi:hypothetical protein